LTVSLPRLLAEVDVAAAAAPPLTPLLSEDGMANGILRGKD
jgi:hypothetical protein